VNEPTDQAGENRAAVVGGSIGGLTAGLLLRDAGWEVDVFERSGVVLQGRGGGIVLHPAGHTRSPAMHHAAFVALGIDAAYVAFDVAPPSLPALRAHERARPLPRLPHAPLRRLLASYGRDRYHLAEECIGLHDPGGNPWLEFASGRLVPADLVVFADGINSIGRRLLAPEAEPCYAGYVAWRGTVDDDRVEPGTLGKLADAITYHVLPDGHFITYPIPGIERPRRLLNWLWYRNVRPGAELEDLLTGDDETRFTTSVPRGLVRHDRSSELARGARTSLPPVLAEILTTTPEPFIQVIFDLSVERTTSGRACLIGDAAFTARPHIAVGTAKAAEDAGRWRPRSTVQAAVMSRTR
jgi:2,6-dihydroxypyridine 3-monooxygenase